MYILSFKIMILSNLMALSMEGIIFESTSIFQIIVFVISIVFSFFFRDIVIEISSVEGTVIEDIGSDSIGFAVWEIAEEKTAVRFMHFT